MYNIWRSKQTPQRALIDLVWSSPAVQAKAVSVEAPGEFGIGLKPVLHAMKTSFRLFRTHSYLTPLYDPYIHACNFLDHAGFAQSIKLKPSLFIGGYADQKPSLPRKSGKPEQTPNPAPAVIIIATTFIC